jgi:hypothetical protein
MRNTLLKGIERIATHQATAMGFPEDDAAQRGETSLPSLHSARLAPDLVPTLDTGVRALTAAAMDLLGKTD